jgi:Fur family ferric uptake transcriptional regulator
VTAVDLLRSLRRERPDFPESTVYRTLERLVEVGALTRIEVDGGPAVHHLATSSHHHVSCERCGRVFGVDSSLLDPVSERLRTHHGFLLRPDAVTLPGRCVDCEAAHPSDVGGHHAHL